MAPVAFKGKVRTEDELKNGPLCAPTSAVPVVIADEEECLWEAAVANSIDAFREMAEKARENRRAGRTKKITL